MTSKLADQGVCAIMIEGERFSRFTIGGSLSPEAIDKLKNKVKFHIMKL